MRELPPNPSQFRDLNSWAEQLYEFMLAQTPGDTRVEPTPILLAQRLATLDARAATDGILMYDPVAKTPILSVDGVWLPTREAPLIELEYTEAFNVDGDAIGTGGVKIPFSAANVVLASWATFNATTNDFDLTVGSYLFQGYVALTKTAAGAKSLTGYLAASSDLTTAIGSVSMPTVHFPSSAPNDTTIIAPIRGQVDIDADGTYALVVNTSDSDLQFGNAHGISGYSNVYANIGISKVGLNE